MIPFADRLMEQVQLKNSALVVGLDPNVRNFPRCLQPRIESAESICEAIFQFNQLIINAIHRHVAIVKPQLAYYEIYGSRGIRALERTIAYAKSKNLIVINDAKRNDIDSSAAAYAQAYLHNEMPLCGDAVTVSPYLGSDGIKPFLDVANANGNGIFVLLKTSNPSSGELQDLQLSDGRALHEEVAYRIQELSAGTYGKKYSCIGAVVGATYPQTAAILRRCLPNTLFLVPGYGAQGGTAANLSGFWDEEGNGALVSASRSIIYSYMQRPDWHHLEETEIERFIAAAVLKANAEINRARSGTGIEK